MNGLKSKNEREALSAVDDLEGMNDSEFTSLLARRMNVLDETERDAARDMITRRIDTWSESETLSLREVILLDLQSIIRAHYSRGTR